MLTLGSPLESLSTNGDPRVYRGEYTWQQTVPLTQLNLSMQARDLERMSILYPRVLSVTVDVHLKTSEQRRINGSLREGRHP